MRDWSKAFRRASFRGVGFWVDGDGPEKGRRVAVNEISGGNEAVIEDMGRLATRFRVDAYVASDQADTEGRSLEEACDANGPSILRLPMDPDLKAHCDGCRRDRRKDKNGWVGYDLSFVVAGDAVVADASALSSLRGAFLGDLTTVATALAGAFR